MREEAYVLSEKGGICEGIEESGNIEFIPADFDLVNDLLRLRT